MAHCNVQLAIRCSFARLGLVPLAAIPISSIYFDATPNHLTDISSLDLAGRDPQRGNPKLQNEEGLLANFIDGVEVEDVGGSACDRYRRLQVRGKGTLRIVPPAAATPRPRRPGPRATIDGCVVITGRFGTTTRARAQVIRRRTATRARPPDAHRRAPTRSILPES